ncbi:hypothetical protein L209DRAFT_497539 [Thermothelomyces heterothallicus CBS 203.75]
MRVSTLPEPRDGHVCSFPVAPSQPLATTALTPKKKLRKVGIIESVGIRFLAPGSASDKKSRGMVDTLGSPGRTRAHFQTFPRFATVCYTTGAEGEEKPRYCLVWLHTTPSALWVAAQHSPVCMYVHYVHRYIHWRCGIEVWGSDGGPRTAQRTARHDGNKSRAKRLSCLEARRLFGGDHSNGTRLLSVTVGLFFCSLRSRFERGRGGWVVRVGSTYVYTKRGWLYTIVDGPSREDTHA